MIRTGGGVDVAARAKARRGGRDVDVLALERCCRVPRMRTRRAGAAAVDVMVAIAVACVSYHVAF